ncbi:hypothetical protein [Sulfitobacter pontiacus]|uniref:hypothetical protein n=1 Tax=Sulfitobacter pontiacus TaxID=60137 RepID=UPI0036DA9AB3
MNDELTEFQKHFVRPMVQENQNDPLIFIELLANMAETSPVLMQAMMDALRLKAEWYQTQAESVGSLIELNRIAAEEGKKGGAE